MNTEEGVAAAAAAVAAAVRNLPSSLSLVITKNLQRKSNGENWLPYSQKELRIGILTRIIKFWFDE
jgi:hypothetical protein